jgi:WD40 repeat protein
VNQQTMHNLSLFELLARSWQLETAIDAVCFAADGSVAAFSCTDGGLVLARVADSDPPEARIRVSADLGQATIRPRERRPEALVATGSLRDRAPAVVPADGSGFLVAAAKGVLRLDADGSSQSAASDLDGPFTALDHAAGTRVTAASNGAEVLLSDADGSTRRLADAATGDVTALAFSPTGDRLAVAGGDRIAIWNTPAETSLLHVVDIAARPLGLRWSADGRWLACPLGAGGFTLIDVDSRRHGTVPDFPAPVRTVSWSTSANALLASGAFRIAGWSMESPPLDDTAAGAIVTGRSGLVIVETVAAHPIRPLVAAGYTNGQIVVGRIGARDELLVKPSGGAVTALAWSPDGRHLAAGTVDGQASVVTFPPQLFK